jgi:endonuclease/exonuclease/phosphatase family metal-dependent hydrolase
MKILTWNLFHGRAAPAAGRDLREEFFAALAAWDWDAALLQEVPPWWARPLAERCRASMRMVLTSRNELLPLRRAVAERWPDLIKSNGGGCNAILVRGPRIAEHRTCRLRRLPERRWMHAVRLDGGLWLGNLHAQTQPRRRPERDIARAGAALTAWAGAPPAPAILGGDFNIPDPAVATFARVASHGVDHVLARGLRAGAAQVLDARPLSDHRPLGVELVTTLDGPCAA